jgi:predicted TPR repeat methyltransferase
MTFSLLGHALCKQGRHEEAARAYQEAARLTPEDRYYRQMAAIYNLAAPMKRTPPEFLRQAFDACANGFDAHEAALGYAIPELIASVVASHPALSAANELGPALDLGCGTGLVVAALADLPTGPFTGIDLSPAMLAEARRKERYADLQEADIMSFLKRDVSQWPLVIAADVVPYFGELTELMIGISQRLSRDGWFVFSTEQLLADRDGVLPGNGEWALQHEGRFAHSQSYLYDCLYEAGLRIVRKDECFIRHEAGTQVPGLLVVAAPVAA